MFCMYCGTQLPDEAAFCFNCGKKAGRPTGNLVDSPEKVATQKVAEESFSNERNQKMLYVKGYGVYFFKEGAIGFYSERTKSIKELKKEEDEYRDFWGLAQYQNAVYYWAYADDSQRLYRVDFELNRKELFYEDMNGNLAGVFGTNENRVILKGNYYYFMNSDKNQLLRFSLETKDMVKQDLPDMRTIPLPAEWAELKHILVLDEEAVNYGNQLQGFYIVGNRGFVCVSGMGDYTLSFDLDNPADFQYMKLNTICPNANQQLVTTVANNDREVFSVFNGFHCLQFDEEGQCLAICTIIDMNSFEKARIGESNSDWFVDKGVIYLLGNEGENGFAYKKGKKPCLIKGNYHEEIFGIKDSIDVLSIGKSFVLTDERLLEFSKGDNIISIIKNNAFSQYVVAEWEN